LADHKLHNISCRQEEDRRIYMEQIVVLLLCCAV